MATAIVGGGVVGEGFGCGGVWVLRGALQWCHFILSNHPDAESFTGPIRCISITSLEMRRRPVR